MEQSLLSKRIKCAHDKIVELIRLQPHPRNPNKHPDRQIEILAKIIEHQGQRMPIVVSKRSGFIVAGHGRLMALTRLGWLSAAVDYQDFENDADEYAHMVADNKIAELAKHDDAMMIEDIKAFEFDDFEILGLDNFKIEEIELERPGENDVPENVDTRCKPGDRWNVGDHILLCGDSTVATDVTRLLNGAVPLLMATDPPYGVKYEAGWRAEAKGVKKTEREINSNLKNDDRSDWYDAYVLFPGSVAYVWHACWFSDVVMDGLRRSGFDIKAQIIWNKNVHALSRSDYHWKHEPCWYAVKTGCKSNWMGGRKNMTVWDIQNVMFEKDAGGKTSHPTQKPIEIFGRSIANHLEAGQSLYDPFGGSGSTLIACEKANRQCFMMELDPHYCSVILSRWEKFTGQQAQLSDKK